MVEKHRVSLHGDVTRFETRDNASGDLRSLPGQMRVCERLITRDTIIRVQLAVSRSPFFTTRRRRRRQGRRRRRRNSVFRLVPELPVVLNINVTAFLDGVTIMHRRK